MSLSSILNPGQNSQESKSAASFGFLCFRCQISFLGLHFLMPLRFFLSFLWVFCLGASCNNFFTRPRYYAAFSEDNEPFCVAHLSICRGVGASRPSQLGESSGVFIRTVSVFCHYGNVGSPKWLLQDQKSENWLHFVEFVSFSFTPRYILLEFFSFGFFVVDLLLEILSFY